jgi:hypothetical protein
MVASSLVPGSPPPLHEPKNSAYIKLRVTRGGWGEPGNEATLK